MTKSKCWQDIESEMRKEQCRGCDYLADRIQERAFDESGRKRKAVPDKVMHCFCRYHQLHLEFIDRIYGKGKECTYYEN